MHQIHDQVSDFNRFFDVFFHLFVTHFGTYRVYTRNSDGHTRRLVHVHDVVSNDPSVFLIRVIVNHNNVQVNENFLVLRRRNDAFHSVLIFFYNYVTTSRVCWRMIFNSCFSVDTTFVRHFVYCKMRFPMFHRD